MKTTINGGCFVKRIFRGEWVYPLITVLFSITWAVILLLIACSDVIEYACKPSYVKMSLGIMICAASIMIIACLSMTYLQKKAWRIDVDAAWWAKLLSVILFALQIVISYNIFFLTGWDSGVVRSIAMQLSSGSEITGWLKNYHAHYPNNLLMTLLQTTLLRIHTLFPIFKDEYAYMIVTATNCLCITLACYCSYLVLTKLINVRWAIIGFGICILLAGLSPWMVIPYSDTFGLLFPILIFNTFLDKREETHAEIKKWIKIVFFSVIGFFIKPQCVIVLIAILGISIARNIDKRYLIKFLCIAVSLLLAFMACDTILNSMAAVNNIELNDETAMDWPHFLMMGLNSERNGIYSQEDVDISTSIATAAERRSMNFQIASERIKDLGVVGLIRHWGKKLLTAFNDGMFAWGMEGTFYSVTFDLPNDTLAPLLQSMLYSYGSNYSSYALVIHTIWIGVLLMAGAAFLYKAKDDYQRKGIAIVRLSLVGLVLFELLFEVRARYLFAYIPFFVCMAVCGMHGLTEVIARNFLKAK